MTSPEKYAAYFILPPKRTSGDLFFSQPGQVLQEKRLQDFLQAHAGAAIIKTFSEVSNTQRHRNRWPELGAAVSYCLENNIHLVIAEIRNLTNNDAFVKHILRFLGPHEHFTGKIFCCDQPFIQAENFLALIEHAKQQKKLHGQLIKAGLSRTTAKSGNPNAAKLISEVNKPKIDNAIIFALLLQPVITEYRHKGYSQRKMVDTLNTEGFTAPEGGHWVLSQLQKVLDRIKMNEAALTLEKKFLEYRGFGMNAEAIAIALAKLDIPSPRGNRWSEEVVNKVSERIKQIHDIIRLNDFVIELMPILNKYHIDEITEEIFAKELQESGLQVPDLLCSSAA